MSILLISNSFSNPSYLDEVLAQIAIEISTEICKCSWIARCTWDNNAFCCSYGSMAYNGKNWNLFK